MISNFFSKPEGHHYPNKQVNEDFFFDFFVFFNKAILTIGYRKNNRVTGNFDQPGNRVTGYPDYFPLASLTPNIANNIYIYIYIWLFLIC